MTTKPGRIPCQIPFCRRTADAAKFPGCSEIICGPCSRLVPDVRRVYRRARKELKLARLMADEAGTYHNREDYVRAMRAERRFDRVWESFKRRAAAARLRAMGDGR